MPPLVAQEQIKTLRSVTSITKITGLIGLLVWLLESATKIASFSNQPVGQKLGVLYADNNPRDDYYLNLDIRVLGASVLVGYYQIL